MVAAAVVKPGENSSSTARCASSAGGVGVEQPARDRDARDGCGIDPAPVVAHADDHVAAGMACAQLERPERPLASGDALVRRLEAVVERVAHEVHERVAERVDDGAVELRVLPDEPQLDLLAEPRSEVAHESREAQEDRLDRDHPHARDRRLQRARAAREALDRL